MSDTGRLRRFEGAALRGVWRYEAAQFTRYWKPQTFGALFEPAFMLLAFGYGVGSLVAAVAGISYRDFVATGVVGTAALFLSVFPAMFNGYTRRVFQHTYDAVLAAPVDLHELLAGETVWTAARAGVFGSAPLLVGMVFGLDPAPGMLLVPFIVFATAFGLSLFGAWTAARVASINSLDYVITGVVTPLMLVAGTYFPMSSLPGWAQVAAHANPVFHCVELVRHAVFGFRPLADLGHLAGIAAFAAVAWTLALRTLRRKLIA
ncbi:ABC transporter permease [Actinomadura rayongensis]|uniref:Transport permease protein n=1 Tax=Actinomadura rayongensis TaxID=1429076 RepID=A0A6I4W394_9ACTN|nr:ABC transporter permease [Actinomadura rayongensis]